MKQLYFTLLSLLFSLSAWAGGSDASASLFNTIKSYETLSASFSQRIVDRDQVVIQESSGEFKLARPNKIYWKTLPPYEQEIIGDGQVLWVYDADLEQVTQYSDGELLQGPMALFSNSLEQINNRFFVELEANQQGDEFVERYTLSPVDNTVDEGFSALVFEFKDAELAVIEIHDKLRQTTVLSLSDLEVNAVISEQTFQFVAPEGVDVLVNE